MSVCRVSYFQVLVVFSWCISIINFVIMEKVKRDRSANFSSDERDLLVSLVQKHRNIIENKQCDGATWKKKELAWENIEKEFNAQSGGTFRSSKTLRIKYEGLKRTVRKKSATIRSELYCTGGGPNTATPLDSTEIHIKSLISLSTDGLESVYDSDVLPPVQNKEDELKLSMEEYIVLPSTSEDLELMTETDSAHFDEPPIKKQHILNENETATDESLLSNMKNDNESENGLFGTTPPSHKKWDVASRGNLKTKKHAALFANTPKNSKKLFDVLTEKKLELVQLQKELLEAEIIEKKKEWEFNEKERQWKEEVYKLKLAKLRKELND